MIQDTHHLSVRRNGDGLALGFDLGPVSFGKYPRGNNHQVLPEGNLAAQIVGETAGGVGDVLAFFEDDDFLLLGKPPQPGGCRSSGCGTADNHCFVCHNQYL